MVQDKTTRISFDDYIMQICHSVAARATCRHRDQGAVIINGKQIVSTGYNGAPSGVKDCLERGYCSKIEGVGCLAEGLHGESNAIISAARKGVSVEGCIIYCVFSPCKICANMIKTAGIVEVVYEDIYSTFPEGPDYVKSLGLMIRQLKKHKDTKDMKEI